MQVTYATWTPAPDRGCAAAVNLRVAWLRRPMDIIRIIAAIVLPPLGVFLQVGIGKAFWLNILLTLLGYIPGIVHAIWIIAKK
jgi:uncharacterized membrane protein YqaE (UPF0057 family)